MERLDDSRSTGHLLKKRKRRELPSDILASLPMKNKTAKRPKLPEEKPEQAQQSSAVYKSLFDESCGSKMANDGEGGHYEGDFMTRSAKFGLQ